MDSILNRFPTRRQLVLDPSAVQVLDLTGPVHTADSAIYRDVSRHQAAGENPLSDRDVPVPGRCDAIGSNDDSNSISGSNKEGDHIGDDGRNSDSDTISDNTSDEFPLIDELLSSIPKEPERLTVNSNLDEERLGSLREQCPGHSQENPIVLDDDIPGSPTEAVSACLDPDAVQAGDKPIEQPRLSKERAVNSSEDRSPTAPPTSSQPLDLSADMDYGALGVERATPQSQRHLNGRGTKRIQPSQLSSRGRPAETDDLRLYPKPRTSPPQHSLASRKRSLSFDNARPLGDALLSERPRRKITKTRKAKEAERMSAEPDEGNVPGYAYPRQHLDWRVKDLDKVHLAKDGSIQCTVIWEATVVAKVDLVGAALHHRCEELFKEAYGQDEWNKWLTTHGASKRRCKTRV